MKRRALLGSVLVLALACACGRNVPRSLPRDFPLHPETDYGGIGGPTGSERGRIAHDPVIFVSDNFCDPADWMGTTPSNPACDACDVYGRFRRAGFAPIELWLLRVMPPGKAMQSLEEHTDDLRRFLYSVLRYTGAPKTQIVGHGAGAVLAHHTLKKYNLYNLVHAAVYLAGPMHGTSRCDWLRCFGSEPVCCSLTPGSTLLRDLLLPHPTPYSALDGRGREPWSVKYMTLRNGRGGGDKWFPDDPDSPALAGAVNRVLPDQDHAGLRCSDESLALVIPFLFDAAVPCAPENDRDGDGFCDAAKGGSDCNDNDPTIYPGAPEICEDGIDQDCNGFDFSCTTGRDIPLAPRSAGETGRNAR